MTDPIKCFYFDHGYDTHINGPCCYENILGKNSFVEMHQRPKYIEIKQAFDSGHWPEKYCSVCKNLEAINNPDYKSKRQWGAHLYELYKPVTNKISELIVHTGTLCNLQCRSCGLYCSSSWKDENSVLPNTLKIKAPNTDSGFYMPVVTDFSQEDFSEIKQVNLIGGEPLYGRQSFAILEKVYDEAGENCVIHFTTNGTFAIEPSAFPWLHKFKSVNINISIDAVGAEAEFIRTGCQWDKVDKNVRNLLSSGIITNGQFKCSPTYSVMNLFSVSRLHTWINEIKILNNTYINFVTYPSYLSYSVLTDCEKELAVTKLTDSLGSFIIPRILTSPHNPDDRDKFFKFMEHTKRYHNMDWKDYLPELYTLMNH